MEDKKSIISDSTALSIGIVVLVVAAAVSWGIMYQKVNNIETNLNVGNYDKRLTILETTIPQINTNLEALKNQQGELLKALKK